jgi:hypothetical protein
MTNANLASVYVLYYEMRTYDALRVVAFHVKEPHET